MRTSGVSLIQRGPYVPLFQVYVMALLSETYSHRVVVQFDNGLLQTFKYLEKVLWVPTPKTLTLHVAVVNVPSEWKKTRHGVVLLHPNTPFDKNMGPPS